VATTVLAGTLLLAACGSSTRTLNSLTVQHAIVTSIISQHGIAATVSCPQGVPQQAGVAFTCAAKLDAGTYYVKVAETNNAGQVRYENQAPLVVLDIEAVEKSIEQAMLDQHLRAVVTCPSTVLQQEGVTFSCAATASGRIYRFDVVERDNSGHVRYMQSS